MFKSEPIHKTNNLLLRFIANNIFGNVAHFYLTKSLKYYFRYEDQFDTIDDFKPPLVDNFKMKMFVKFYNILDKPYKLWGTVYRLILEDPTDGES